jgi:tetratricopeptide (TPR) repeat protein
LQIDPKLDYVYNNLGYSYLLKGDPQKAAKAFQQAIALNEKEKRYRNNLGLVYVKQDKFELAFEQFSALDSEANAKKTLAKVMKDLGKGAATENVLLAVKSVHRKEDVAKPVTPTSKLPELSAKTPETTPGQDPVAHFRSVKNGINTLRDLEIYSDAQDPAISDQSDAAARASADDQDELVAEVKEEHEERILVAAFSVKAGGWQNAPEPKRTAEMGIVEVEVTNGNGMKGSAGKVAEHLRRNGFKVVRVLDAQSHDHFSTKVFYGGNLKEAQRLLKAIPEIASGAELYELESMGGHIRLLIGKDLIERNKILSWVNPNAKS